MATTVGGGKYAYEVNEDWARLPEGWAMPAAGVAVDSQDRVFVFNRDPVHPIVIFDREGNYLSSWGGGLIAFAHSILIDKGENVWLVDRNNGQVMKFTTEGELLMTIGTKEYRSDTGVDLMDFGSNTAYKAVTHGGEPFNLPACMHIAPSGELFVSDGYANCRVHKFSSEGKLLLSWGEPGDGPGQFKLPHGVWVDRRGRVLVADRENDRVQVFTQEGEYITTWPTHLDGPSMFYVDDEDTVYVPEHNGGLISILTLDGERLARWGSITRMGCHGVYLDSRRDMYVVQKPESGEGARRVVKFIRKG